MERRRYNNVRVKGAFCSIFQIVGHSLMKKWRLFSKKKIKKGIFSAIVAAFKQ